MSTFSIYLIIVFAVAVLLVAAGFILYKQGNIGFSRFCHHILNVLYEVYVLYRRAFL